MATSSPAPATRRGRLVGVDAARGLALLGMMATHVIPAVGPDGDPTASHLLASGRASALFALLAGVGLALASGGSRPPRGADWSRAGLATAARAAVLVLAGLLLGLFESGVAVILVYYGILFLCAIPFLGLGARVLLPLAGVSAMATPVISQVLRQTTAPPSYDNPVPESLADPSGLLVELVLTGYYPVLTWTAYLLAGLGVGRLALRSRRTAVVLLASGSVMALASWVGSWLLLESGGFARLEAAGVGDHPISVPLSDDVLHASFYGTTPVTTEWWLAIASPHSGAPLDLLHTTGTAVGILGLMLLLTRVARRVVWPLAAVGGMTFTLYSLHVVLLGTAIPRDAEHAYLLHVIVAFVVAVPIAALGIRGPLEAIAARAAAALRSLVPAGRDGRAVARE